MRVDLPDPKFAVLDAQGRPGTPFWRFLEGTFKRVGGQGDVKCLTVAESTVLSASATAAGLSFALSGTTITVALTDDTTLTFSATGSDGVTRSGTLALT